MISASLNPPIADEMLEALTATYSYGRYCEDRSLSLNVSRRYLRDHLRQLLRQESINWITVEAKGQTRGMLLFRLSEWDTDHFGFNVAIIEAVLVDEIDYERAVNTTTALLSEFETWRRASDISFISVKLPALALPIIHGFEKCGFNYIESWVFNKYDLDKIDRLGQTTRTLRLAQADDCERMLAYAQGAFATHRFHADAHISLERAEALYEKWIVTAFNDPKQKILTLDVEDRPAAFMIYYPNDLRSYFGIQFAQWKMAVLDPNNRGQGVGTDFFIALAHHHRQEGLDVIDSGLTVRNLASLNLHNKLNFKVVSTLVTFHKWLKS